MLLLDNLIAFAITSSSLSHVLPHKRQGLELIKSSIIGKDLEFLLISFTLSNLVSPLIIEELIPN